MTYHLGIITTHPIQYQVPWFRALSAHPDIELTVFFCSRHGLRRSYDEGFGKEFSWDIPLLEGYRYVFLNNVSGRPSVSSFWGLNTPGVGHRIARANLDALVVTGWHSLAYWQAILSAIRLSLPLVLRTEFRGVPDPRWPWNCVKRTVLSELFRRTSAFLTIGTANREAYLRYGACSDRLFHVPYSVDNDRFARESEQARRDRSKLRRAWGLDPEAFVFIYSGKLIEKKRPLDLLRAFADVKISRCQLLIVGDGPLRDVCQEQAAVYGNRVVFAGFVNQSHMPVAYALADCLVLPSDWLETWGLSVNEAMACSLPAIVSDRVGCAPDLIRNGQTGYVFSFGNAEELSSLMCGMAEDRQNAAHMGEQARRHIQQFSVGKAVDGTIRALRAVTKK